jgi:polyphosphate kinase 2 (PPK2 family)
MIRRPRVIKSKDEAREQMEKLQDQPACCRRSFRAGPVGVIFQAMDAAGRDGSSNVMRASTQRAAK